MTPALRPVDYRIDPFDLRMFISVIDTGTITAAAARMGLSLAAASTRLKALETQVGARLLDRSKAGASPTDAGRALARQAHRVLAELETLHLEMSGFAGGLRGRLRVLANTSAMVEALPRVLGSFLRAHPDLDIDLQEMPSEKTLEALREGAADLGIVASHVDTSGLVMHEWLDDPLVAVWPGADEAGVNPAGARLAGTDLTEAGWAVCDEVSPPSTGSVPPDEAGTHDISLAVPAHGSTPPDEPLRFSDVLALPFVGLPADSGLSRFLAQQARQSGRLPHHRVRVSSVDAVMSLVAAGVGVSVLPLNTARRWSAGDVVLKPLADAWANRQLRICLDHAADQRPAVRALLDALLSSRPAVHPRNIPITAGLTP